MRPSAARSTRSRTSRSPTAPRKPSGRVKHDEKMTVYVTADELLEIEHARLALRAGTAWPSTAAGWSARRSHLVLADLEHNGEASALVRRLTEE